MRLRLLQSGNFLVHASKFWLGCRNIQSYPNILNDAILVVGINKGLPKDEIYKVKARSLSFVPETVGKVSISFSVKFAIKREHRS